MNYDQPPRTNWIKVLIIVLGSLAVVFVALIFTGYYLVMHTSLPFKMIESVLAQGGTNQNFKVEGISGSIAKGFKIKSITWGEKDKGASQVEDVRLQYSSFWELMGGQRIIFKQIHIGKAHLDVTGIEELLSPTNSPESDATESDDDGTNIVATPQVAAWTNPPAWRTHSRHRSPHRPRNQLFQVDELSIADVFITNRVTGFGLSVPAIEWKGFKAQGETVELGQLTVNSDRLKVETSAGETVPVNGQPVTFQKKLEGTILPLLHKSVRKPLAFRIDASHTGSNLVWRLSSFEGRLEMYQAADESGFLRCKDADLNDYFDAPVPEHLTAEAAMSRKGTKEMVKLDKGSFRLGATIFQIQPQDSQKTEGSTATNHLTAVSRSADLMITYHLLIPDEPWKIEQRLTSEPPLKPQELLAKVFYGKPFAQLSESEQKAVESKKAGFSGWPTELQTKRAPIELEKP